MNGGKERYDNERRLFSIMGLGMREREREKDRGERIGNYYYCPN